MRSKKWLTIITLGASCTALIVAIISHTENGSLTYDISLAVFGSALLGFVMSLTEYFAARRAAMERFYAAGCKVLSEFRKIKYVDLDAPKSLIQKCFKEESNNAWSSLSDSKASHEAKNAFLSWCEGRGLIPYTVFSDEEGPIDPDHDQETLYTTKIEQYLEIYKNCAKSYIEASKISLSELDSAYGDLDFLVGNRSVRKNAWYKIHNKFFSFVKLISEKRLNRYFENGDAGDVWALVKGTDEVCMIFFNEENRVDPDGNRFLVYQTKFDDIDTALEDFRIKIYLNTTPEYQEPVPVLGRLSEPRYFGED